jgi:GcrA cell cycle regulator
MAQQLSCSASGSSWTDQREAQLRRMWGDGLSCGQIARRLDTTRNPVVGKAHRLGLTSRIPSTAAERRVALERRRARAQRKPVDRNPPVSPTTRAIRELMCSANIEVLHDIDVGRKDLLDLEPGDYRWPTTHRPPHRFFGQQKVTGLPYCRRHARIAYQSVAAATPPCSEPSPPKNIETLPPAPAPQELVDAT